MNSEKIILCVSKEGKDKLIKEAKKLNISLSAYVCHKLGVDNYGQEKAMSDLYTAVKKLPKRNSVLYSFSYGRKMERNRT